MTICDSVREEAKYGETVDEMGEKRDVGTDRDRRKFTAHDDHDTDLNIKRQGFPLEHQKRRSFSVEHSLAVTTLENHRSSPRAVTTHLDSIATPRPHTHTLSLVTQSNDMQHGPGPRAQLMSWSLPSRVLQSSHCRRHCVRLRLQGQDPGAII